jgi:hypothetical protein
MFLQQRENIAIMEEMFSTLPVKRCYNQDQLAVAVWQKTAEVQSLSAVAVRSRKLRPGTDREPRRRGTSAVRSRYQATAIED